MLLAGRVVYNQNTCVVEILTFIHSLAAINSVTKCCMDMFNQTLCAYVRGLWGGSTCFTFSANLHRLF